MYIDIRNQPHEMRAEGSEYYRPKRSDITRHLEKEGYIAKNIDVEWDTFQEVFRWNCDIEVKLENLNAK